MAGGAPMAALSETACRVSADAQVDDGGVIGGEDIGAGKSPAGRVLPVVRCERVSVIAGERGGG